MHIATVQMSDDWNIWKFYTSFMNYRLLVQHCYVKCKKSFFRDNNIDVLYISSDAKFHETWIYFSWNSQIYARVYARWLLQSVFYCMQSFNIFVSRKNYLLCYGTFLIKYILLLTCSVIHHNLSDPNSLQKFFTPVNNLMSHFRAQVLASATINTTQC